MLRDAGGGGGVSDFLEESINYEGVGVMLLALRGVGGGPISRKKCYVTLPQ